MHELMRVDIGDRDTEWLRQSLHAAVQLELATLPPYLTALWSINDGYGPATAGITAVVKEEMLHMVLAGNMLRAVGGQVSLAGPVYPGHLPGNVMPGLVVPLMKLSKASLAVFMKIEHPDQSPFTTDADGNTYPTIGAFYDAILAAFEAVSPALSGAHQLTGTVGGHAFGPTDTLDKVRHAIHEIQEQGEGASGSPFTDPEFGHELSHFARFSQIFYGHELIWKDGEWVFEGLEIPMPEVFDMAPVPDGGYPNGPPEVGEFNAQYSLVLGELEAAWAAEDGTDKLGQAVGRMFSLQTPAQTLMKTPKPDGTGNYGPDWQRL